MQAVALVGLFALPMEAEASAGFHDLSVYGWSALGQAGAARPVIGTERSILVRQSLFTQDPSAFDYSAVLTRTHRSLMSRHPDRVFVTVGDAAVGPHVLEIRDKNTRLGFNGAYDWVSCAFRLSFKLDGDNVVITIRCNNCQGTNSIFGREPSLSEFKRDVSSDLFGPVVFSMSEYLSRKI